jgi:hypothetical protein
MDAAIRKGGALLSDFDFDEEDFVAAAHHHGLHPKSDQERS